MKAEQQHDRKLKRRSQQTNQTRCSGAYTEAVKTTSQLEPTNIFVFAARTDTRRIGMSDSRADCSALTRRSQLHEFVTRYITRSARLVYTRL
jgi:hypothetical protein